jgi:hypothetical protein
VAASGCLNRLPVSGRRRGRDAAGRGTLWRLRLSMAALGVMRPSVHGCQLSLLTFALISRKSGNRYLSNFQTVLSSGRTAQYEGFFPSKIW